jgi:hypothetical protein
MTTKIFNDRGFLTTEGKALVQDGFAKEMKKIFATAIDYNDTLTISCILKSIIGEAAAKQCAIVREAAAQATQPDRLKLATKRSPVKETIPSLNNLSDVPPIE